MSKTFVRSDYDKSDYLLIMDTPETAAPSTSPDLAARVLEDMSGSPGTDSILIKVGRNVKLPNPNHYYAITGLGLEEEWDKPCKLTLFGTLVDPRYQGETRVVARYQLKKCKKPPLVDFKGVSFYSHRKNEEKKFVRSNCPENWEASEGSGDPGWSPTCTQCPPDHVAAGVRAYHYKNNYFTGLDLYCQKVVSRRISKCPLIDEVGY